MKIKSHIYGEDIEDLKKYFKDKYPAELYRRFEESLKSLSFESEVGLDFYSNTVVLYEYIAPRLNEKRYIVEIIQSNMVDDSYSILLFFDEKPEKKNIINLMNLDLPETGDEV